jgi:hypothetical protein
MDSSSFLVLGGALCFSFYCYGAISLRLNDSFRELPLWVPLLWPLLLPVALVALLAVRLVGRTA